MLLKVPSVQCRPRSLSASVQQPTYGNCSQAESQIGGLVPQEQCKDLVRMLLLLLLWVCVCVWVWVCVCVWMWVWVWLLLLLLLWQWQWILLVLLI